MVRKVQTSQWEASYDSETNVWSSQDGLIEKFLNRECVPEVADMDDATDMAVAAFPSLAVDIVS